jgi:3-oxoacyl-[acyl-carrier protein] reductase
MVDLTGKIALVTGSSMGIGKAIAFELAKDGATVVINDPIGGEEAESAVKMIQGIGQEAYYIKCDVSAAAQVPKMIDTILERYKKIDILVNNAAITIDSLTINYEVEDWARMINVNLNGAFLCSKYCLPSMIEQKWGRIVNISTVAAIIGLKGAPAYSASKAGLIGFSKSLAKEVARKGITVNALALGLIKGGGMFDTVREDIMRVYIEQIPMGRPGTPEDVANAIKFLVSDSAAYITGQTIGVNGGFHT